jgi:hypothetical protein
MYTYEITYKDGTVEYVKATDVQSACNAAGCTIEDVSAVIKYD